MLKRFILLAFGLNTANLLWAQNPAPSLTEHKQKAEQALRANDRVQAEHEYREMLSLAPDDSQAWSGLGILLYGEGKPEQASQALQRALQLDAIAPRAELFLALSRADLGECPQAMPALTKYFDSEPVSNLQRLTGLALLGCATGSAEASAALRAAARLQQLYPSDADVLYESAEVYTRLWNESAAELLAKHPDSYRVHQLAGEVYEAQKNYEQAIREFSLALEKNPKLPQLHFRIGQLYLQQGAADADAKAMQQFQMEKAVNPGSGVSDLAMAEIDRHQHKLDEAKVLYEEACRADPRLVEARVGLAQTLLAQHKPDLALHELDGVIAEHPDNATAHYTRMLAYREQGKSTEAAAEMAMFRQLQTAKDQTFQDKLNALLNAKPKSGDTNPQ